MSETAAAVGEQSVAPVAASPPQAGRSAARAARRRILLLNQYYPPDTSATAKIGEEVVRALATRFDVVVLAGRPSYDPSEYHPYYLLRRTQSGPVTVERVGSSAFHRRSGLGRIANYLSYAVLALPRGLAIPTDIVLSMTDPPFAGILGAIVARLRGKPFVYNIRDLHPDMAISSGLLQPSAVTRAWDRLHRWALRGAARVIVLGDDMRRRVLEKGAAEGSVAVVRDGARLPAGAVAPRSDTGLLLRGTSSFVAVHAGNLGFYGAWNTLVEGVRRLRRKDISFVFVGAGADLERVRALAAGCEGIRFLPFFPAANVPDMLAAADVHVVTVRHGIEGLVVPSKLYPILAAGRPVLAVAPANSDVAEIVVRSGCGLVADPDRPEEVASALEQLASDCGRLEEMGLRARAVASEFEIERQLGRFVEIINEV